jgi:hypothetical protein
MLLLLAGALALGGCELEATVNTPPDQLDGMDQESELDESAPDTLDLTEEQELYEQLDESDAVDLTPDAADRQDEYEDGDQAEQDLEPDELDQVEPEPDAPLLYPAAQVQSPLSPYVVQRLREIAALSSAPQQDVFMKVGASGTVSSSFFYCLATSSVELDGRDELQPCIDHFVAGNANDGGVSGPLTPFDRPTYAAEVGRTAAWAMSGSPSPVEREREAINPRFALVNYGTNDMNMGATYESALYPFYDNYTGLLDQVAAQGIIPVVTSILPRGDSSAADLWVPTYNAVIRGIAQTRQIPFVDYHLAVSTLPNRGLSGDGVHANAHPGSACRFDAEGLSYGYNMRNLITLEALDRTWRAVQFEEASDETGIRIQGDGSKKGAFVIGELPFAHAQDTRRSSNSDLDTYSGCNATQDESGPEFYYDLQLTVPTRLRMLVLDSESADIDLHLLGAEASAESCRARAHRMIQGTLAAGRYTVVLDSWVNASGEAQAGEYLFVVVECEAQDAACDPAL